MPASKPAGNKSVPLNYGDSETFRTLLQAQHLDQNRLSEIVKKAIQHNELHIWSDALNEYGLL